MAARGFLGSGDVYIERLVAGVSQGLNGPYYANKFEIKPNVEVKELISKGKNDYGQTLESVALQKPADFTLELLEVNKESLTLALLGSQSTTSQNGGTLTAAAVVIKKDRWVSMGFENFDPATIVVKNAADAVTYVKGTDYVVNEDLGLIKVLPGSAIVDAATLHVSASYLARTSTVISGAVSTDIRAKIIFDGVNQADGLGCKVTVWEAVIAADAAFDFLGDDFGTVNLPGKMKTPTGKSSPFIVEIRNAA